MFIISTQDDWMADSTALKDVIHMNNKVFLLVSMILWDMVMSHLKLPTRPNAGLRAGKEETEAGFRTKLNEEISSLWDIFILATKI